MFIVTVDFFRPILANYYAKHCNIWFSIIYSYIIYFCSLCTAVMANKIFILILKPTDTCFKKPWYFYQTCRYLYKINTDTYWYLYQNTLILVSKHTDTGIKTGLKLSKYNETSMRTGCYPCNTHWYLLILVSKRTELVSKQTDTFRQQVSATLFYLLILFMFKTLALKTNLVRWTVLSVVVWKETSLTDVERETNKQTDKQINKQKNK